MSRIGSGVITVRPTNDIYTALAFVSFASTLIALGYVCWHMHELGASFF
ncbi:MAG TPA: hypothetical protein VM008_16490 [Phycisphaerae bacterium]|nr:hypothetical protein [Phycisphaerae bacterium]